MTPVPQPGQPEEESLLVLAILTIAPGAAEQFREFEQQAARILWRYGAGIERTMEVEPSAGADLREVHLLRFPSRRAFEQYRADPELAALSSQRSACITGTEILIGREGHRYTA